jgi:hypothetical protein
MSTKTTRPPVAPGDVVTGVETNQKHRQYIMYILTFVFGIATLLALSLAAVQIARSIQLDRVLLAQTERLESINRFLLERADCLDKQFGDDDGQT